MRESRKLSLWEVTRPPVRIEDISWLSYGLLLDYNNAGRMLDEGPRADDTLEAQKFREFWGSKAELRCFDDRVIRETTTWDLLEGSGNNDNQCTRRSPHLVIEAICLYLLHFYFGIANFSFSDSNLIFVYDQLHNFLVSGGGADLNPSNRSQQILNQISSQSQVIALHEEIIKQIKKADLPLYVANFYTTSPLLRYTEVILPPYSDFIPFIDIHLLMESSSKWPDCYEAIQNVKVALYLKLASSLESFESEALQCFVTPAHLEVLKGGIAFKIRIFVEREGFLLRSILCDLVKSSIWLRTFYIKPQ
ncbi:nucleolar protein 6-like [Zophobas morio]|uniref:nucleolar protein 6-like n=1 Tax=Zophobas morio TaxID=2755281 RepID=UPI003083803F